MLIILKYSNDGKNIEIFPFSDACHLVAILPGDKFWIQKDTDEKYQIGEFSDDYLDKISNRPIFVFHPVNIAHLRRLLHFFKISFQREY
jgi:hypothetical protein